MTRPTPISSFTGWAATIALALLASLWGYWGAIETFHEGWWSRNPTTNIEEMLLRYLAPMELLAAVGAVAVVRPRAGAVLLWLGAVAAALRFSGAATPVLLALTAGPALLGAAFWFAGPPRPAIGLTLVLGLPIATALLSGAGPAWRVAHRLAHDDLGSFATSSDGKMLVWAPKGPGWPENGLSWDEANDRAARLSVDGLRLEATPQGIWRLATLPELLGVMANHGITCGGSWDDKLRLAHFGRCVPDKEGPLWDRFSKVIYWWTATVPDEKSAYRVAYNGHVLAVPRSVSWGYLGFRAVRVVDGTPRRRE